MLLTSNQFHQQYDYNIDYYRRFLLVGRAELNFGLDCTQSDQVHVVPYEVRSHLHGGQDGTDGAAGNHHPGPLEVNGELAPRPILVTSRPFTYNIYA
jgi:hypothetical protein